VIRVGSHVIDKAGRVVVCREATASLDDHRTVMARTSNNLIGTDPVMDFRFINGQRVQSLTLSAEAAKTLMLLLMGAFNTVVDGDDVHTNLEAFSIEGMPFPFTYEQYQDYMAKRHAEEEQAEEHPSQEDR